MILCPNFLITSSMTQFTAMCEWIRNIFEYLFPPKPVIETWAIVDILQSNKEATVCVVQSFLTGILCVRKRYNAHSLHVHNEISTLRTISHTNIVRIENVVYDNEFVDILLKKYDTDLFSYIRKSSEDVDVFFSSKSLKLRIDWMQGISEGVQHLHAKRIIHCDIKPENILLRTKISDVDVLLTDFGLAKGKAVRNEYSDHETILTISRRLGLMDVRHSVALLSMDPSKPFLHVSLMCVGT